MGNLGVYILPALLGFVVKIFIVFIADKVDRKRFFYPMLAIFAIHNMCEIMLLLAYFKGSYSFEIIKVYYAATFCALTFMTVYSIDIIEISVLKLLSTPFYVVGSVLAFITFSTDWVVNGAVNIGYATTASRGDYYFIFPTFVLSALIFTILTLVAGIYKAVTQESSKNSFTALLALSPLLISSLILLPILVLGIKVNAIGIVPICTTAFLFIILKGDGVKNNSIVKKWFDNKLNNKLSSNLGAELLEITNLYTSGKIRHKDFTLKIEYLTLRYQYLKSNKNISEMSRLMDIKRSSIYSMLLRHKNVRDD